MSDRDDVRAAYRRGAARQFENDNPEAAAVLKTMLAKGITPGEVMCLCQAINVESKLQRTVVLDGLSHLATTIQTQLEAELPLV